ncbi:MAG: type I CRISPR-associated protein Cas8a1/Csx8, partial [Fusobacteriaceae bacterium]
MEIVLENENIRIEPSDWRWSASIVGLYKYFEYCDIKPIIDDEGIEFDPGDITEERYLKFAESFFSDSMHHIYVEDMLKKDNLTNNEIKELNKKLTDNTVMKNIFSSLKITNDENFKTFRQEILDKIEGNRIKIIKSTYANGNSLYPKFLNRNKKVELKLLKDADKSCRVKGYYLDMARKSKSIAFKRDKKAIVVSDSKYMDFIPFAFSKTRESFFINNNSSVNNLINSNKIAPDNESKSLRSQIFDKSKHASTFINYDVEIITIGMEKDKDGKEKVKDYYETLFIRSQAIKIFEKLEKFNTEKFTLFEILQKPCNLKMRESPPEKLIDIQKEVTNSILNKVYLDSLIESVFKSHRQDAFLNSYLIKINHLIYTGGKYMGDKEKEIVEIAKKINREIAKNKTISYKQKLISAISLKDYDRVQVILIQLSAYSGVKMDFLVELFTDFEKNKNLAYTFINS